MQKISEGSNGKGVDLTFPTVNPNPGVALLRQTRSFELRRETTAKAEARPCFDFLSLNSPFSGQFLIFLI